MYLLELGYSLGPGPDFLILEASSRQPGVVPKPERMTSDGGNSAGVCVEGWGVRLLGDSNLILYLGMSTWIDLEVCESTRLRQKHHTWGS